MMRYRLTRVTLDEAQAFVASVHRTHGPPVGHRFSLGALEDGQLVGVAICGRPVAPHLDDGRTLEVTRVACGKRGLNSWLFTRAKRAGLALGFDRIITYTLPSEGGASLRGAGWRIVARTGEPRSWDRPKRPRPNQTHPLGSKDRWEASLWG